MISAACCGSVLLSGLVSCTWREVGCATGASLAYVGATALLKNYPKLSDTEKAAILAVASSIGCVLGSEIAGGIENYVEKKREEYRTEAEYLQAHIDDMQSDGKDIDAEIAWLQNQTNKLEQEKKNLNKLPAMRTEMNSKMKEAANKRVTDAKRVEKYVSDAKADAEKAYRTTSDVEL